MTKWNGLPVFILVSASMASAHLQEGSLTPKGGETLVFGSKVEISWTQNTGHDGLYDLYYSRNGGSSWTEFVGHWQGPKTDNTKVTYSWTVPSQATTQGQLRVCQLAGGECTERIYMLRSTNFSVAASSSVLPRAGVLQTALSYTGATGNLDVAFEMESAGEALIEAFDAQGKVVATLFKGTRDAGVHRMSFFSNTLASARGPLVFRLTAGGKPFSQYWNGAN